MRRRHTSQTVTAIGVVSSRDVGRDSPRSPQRPQRLTQSRVRSQGEPRGMKVSEQVETPSMFLGQDRPKWLDSTTLGFGPTRLGMPRRGAARHDMVWTGPAS